MSQNEVEFKWDGHSACIATLYSEDKKFCLCGRIFDFGGSGPDESALVMYAPVHNPEDKDVGGLVLKEERMNGMPLWRGVTAEKHLGVRRNNPAITREKAAQDLMKDVLMSVSKNRPAPKGKETT